jgi:hypothetical protein
MGGQTGQAQNGGGGEVEKVAFAAHEITPEIRLKNRWNGFWKPFFKTQTTVFKFLNERNIYAGLKTPQTGGVGHGSALC